MSIDEIKARLAAAPGDWRVSEKRSSGKLVIDANECVVAEASRPEDARDIAQMHADRVALLAEVERLASEKADLNGRHSQLLEAANEAHTALGGMPGENYFDGEVGLVALAKRSGYNEAHIDTWQGLLIEALDAAEAPEAEAHDTWHVIQARIGCLGDERDELFGQVEDLKAANDRLTRELDEARDDATRFRHELKLAEGCLLKPHIDRDVVIAGLRLAQNRETGTWAIPAEKLRGGS